MKKPATAACHRNVLVRTAAVAVVTGWVVFANAGTSSAEFTVSATLVSADSPASGFCTTGPSRFTFGAVVTVVCGTGAVVDIKAPRTAVSWTALHGGAYRYIHVAEYEFRGGRLIDGIESYTGVGTITSWRMVSLADRDYLELQIVW